MSQHFDDVMTQRTCALMTAQAYQPALELVRELLAEDHPLAVSLGLSGLLLEQWLSHHPEMISLMETLATSSQVSFLGMPYYHSLASLYAPEVFSEEAREHRDCLRSLTRREPSVFLNTAGLYFDDLAPLVRTLGFQGMLIEADPVVLNGRSSTQLYQSGGSNLKVSCRTVWPAVDHAPGSINDFMSWLHTQPQDGLIILLVPLEQLADHSPYASQWFEWLGALPEALAEAGQDRWASPEMICQQAPVAGTYSSNLPWAMAQAGQALERWLAETTQQNFLLRLYALEPLARQSNDWLSVWKRLQASDYLVGLVDPVQRRSVYRVLDDLQSLTVKS